MQQWIKELRQYLDDNEVVEFYIDAINELDDLSYEKICNNLGTPEKIAKLEQLKSEPVNVDFDTTDNDFEETNYSVYIDAFNVDLTIKSTDKKIAFCNEQVTNTSFIKQSKNKTSFYINQDRKKNDNMLKHWLAKNFITNAKKDNLVIWVPLNAKLILVTDICNINVNNLTLNKLEQRYANSSITINQIKLATLKTTSLKHSHFMLSNIYAQNIIFDNIFHTKASFNNIQCKYAEIERANHSYLRYNSFSTNQFINGRSNHCLEKYNQLKCQQFEGGFLNHTARRIEFSDIDLIMANGNHSSLFIDNNTLIKDHSRLYNFVHQNHNLLKYAKGADLYNDSSNHFSHNHHKYINPNQQDYKKRLKKIIILLRIIIIICFIISLALWNFGGDNFDFWSGFNLGAMIVFTIMLINLSKKAKDL